MGSVYGGESVASIARSEQEDAAPLDAGVPGMPPSWVPRLQIGRDSLDMRCPRGIKSLLYHRCQHEIFALFGECCRWDGMVEKLTLYEVELLCCAVPCHAVPCCVVLINVMLLGLHIALCVVAVDGDRHTARLPVINANLVCIYLGCCCELVLSSVCECAGSLCMLSNVTCDSSLLNDHREGKSVEQHITVHHRQAAATVRFSCFLCSRDTQTVFPCKPVATEVR